MKGESYYIIYDWMVRAIGAGSALQVYALLHGLCTANGGSCQVSKTYLIERTGLTEKQVEYSVAKLVEDGFVTYKNGRGRGAKSTYSCTEKRVQIKGGKNVPFNNEKRVQNYPIKGGENVPFINNNKDIINTPTKGAHAHENDLKAEPRQWLNDDEEFLTQRCIRNGIRIIGTARETMQPYIEEFIDVQLDLGTDFYLKGRQDTKRHFAAWLKKNHEKLTEQLNNNDSKYNDRRHPGDVQGQDTGAVLQRTYRLEYDPELGNAWRTQRSYF